MQYILGTTFHLFIQNLAYSMLYCKLLFYAIPFAFCTLQKA